MQRRSAARPARRAVTVICSVVSTLVGCHDSPVAPVDRARSVTALSPLEQTIVAGAAVGVPPRVVVRDGASQPVADVAVLFIIPTTSDRPFSRTIRTSSDGTAGLADWTPPGKAGTAELIVRVGKLPDLRFKALVKPGPPSFMSASGDDQVGLAGAALPTNVSVLVIDLFQNGVPGITVAFTALGSAGTTIQNARAVTNDSGVAMAGAWTLGTEPGVYTVVASLDSTVAPVTLKARVNVPFGVSSIAAGGFATCAIATSGGTYCWGQTLGEISQALNTSTPVRVSTAPAFASLTVGGHHACGLTATGGAYCWGANDRGQTGAGTDSALTLTPRAVAGGLAFAQLSAGGEFTCGLATDGRAYCWGANNAGQVGDGTSVGRTKPMAVRTDKLFASITVGQEHACALTPEHKTYCWGRNDSLQVGVATSELCTTTEYDFYYGSYVVRTKCSSSPVLVSLLPDLVSVSAGSGACGLTVPGDAVCWGHSAGLTAISAPVHFVKVVATAGGMCGLSDSGAPYCSKTGSTTSVTPAPRFTDIVAGVQHQCAITADSGYAYCWGTNTAGQLGIGNYATSTFPVPVAKPDR